MVSIPRIGAPTNIPLGGREAPRLNLPGGSDFRMAAAGLQLASRGIDAYQGFQADAERQKAEEARAKDLQDTEAAKAWAPPVLAEANMQTSGAWYQVLGQTGDDGAGLTDRMGSRIDEIWKPYRDAATTPQAKALVETGYLNAREAYAKKAQEKEFDTRQSWRAGQADIAKNTAIASINTAQESGDVDLLFSQNVGSIRSAYDNIEDPAMRGKAVLSAVQEIADAAYARKQVLGAQTTGEVPEQGVVGPVADAIRGAATAAGEDPNVSLTIAALENPKGDPTIKNPKSSATGIFQFTDGTWEAVGGTKADRLDARRQIELGIKLQKQNRTALRTKLGREPTGWELYLAHQQGQGGAMALLNAPGSMSAIDALTPVYDGNRARATEAVVNNGGKADMTAAQFADKWRRKFDAQAAGGAVARLATPEGRKRGDEAAAKIVKEQTEQKVGLLEIAIDEGKADRTTLEAYKRAGVIKPGSTEDVRLSARITTMEEKAAVEAAERAERQDIVSGALSGGRPIDPTDAKSRGMVDDDFEERVQTWAPEVREANSVGYANRVGFVPDAMKAQLVGGMRSTDPDKRLASARLYGRLRATNPALVNGLPGDVSSDAYFLMESQRKGMTPKEAIDALSFAEKMTPEDIQARDSIFTKGLGAKQTIAVSHIRNEMARDKAIKDEKALFGGDFVAPPEMLADVVYLAQRAYRKHGDMEAALSAAYDQARRVWGPSVINGEPRMMKNAPEVIYGIPEMNATDNAKWMREQAAKEFGVDKPKELRFVEAPGLTTREGRPTYFVMRETGDGITQLSKGRETWVPQWQSSPAKAKIDKDRAADNAQKLKQARIGRDGFMDMRDDPKTLYDAMQVQSEGGPP